MTLQKQKGEISYLDIKSGWRFIQGSSRGIKTKDKFSLFDCKIQETDRNTFLVKTRTDVIKEYPMNEISCITYKIKTNEN